MSTVLEVAGPVVVCGWFFITFAHTFTSTETAEEEQ